MSLVAGGIVVSVPGALGQSLSDEKRDIDARISGLQQQIQEAKAEEGVLTSEIEAATAQVNGLSADIGVLNDRVAALEHELAANRALLDELKELHHKQTRHLRLLRSQLTEAEKRLEERLVELYTTEQPDAIAVILGAGSLNELIEQVELLNEIGRQDREIAATLKTVKAELRVARRETAATKSQQATVTAAAAEKTAEQRGIRDALVVRQNELVAARSEKESLLGQVGAERREAEEDLAAMQAASRNIAARIQAAQSQAASASGASASSPQASVGGGGSPSAAGFVWPVGGVLTSGFGPRWGRMHEGIDVAAPTGTPIVAAASGTVIYSGWMGGYGNLVIIDHGGGIATAYGHQSAIYVTAGPVSQGQAIGAIGSTGHSTGPHLHFEVRINGAPVDPLGYL